MRPQIVPKWIIIAAVLTISPVSAEEVLYCTDTAGTGFRWFGNNQEGAQGNFTAERYTVKVLSDSERIITRLQGDTAGESEQYTCTRPYAVTSPDVISCNDIRNVEPWRFHHNRFVRAFLAGPPAGGNDPNVWIS